MLKRASSCYIKRYIPLFILKGHDERDLRRVVLKVYAEKGPSSFNMGISSVILKWDIPLVMVRSGHNYNDILNGVFHLLY